MLRKAWPILLLLLHACAAHAPRAPVGDHSERPVHNPGYHRVQGGDTLYSIAFEYGYSVQELAKWNHLRPPYTIYRGQRLRVKPPSTSGKRRPSASQPKPRTRVIASRPKTQHSTTATTAGSRKRTSRTATASRKPGSATSSAGRHHYPARVLWSWPARGRILRRFNPSGSGKKGIDIAGNSGDPVRAAAAGRVVYAGSGLSGYGRLIIIKHNKEFLSAYAHNRTLIAREGQWVRKGEVIARMGSSGTDRTRLHFEIRRRGRPVDPLRYLPAR